MPGWTLGGRYFGQGSDVGGVFQVIWSDLEDLNVQAHGGDAGMGAFHGSDASGGPGSTYSDETNPGGQGFSGHHGHVHTTFNRNPFTGEPYGIADQNTTLGDWSAFPPWVKQLGDMYGLDAKTYTGHQVWGELNHGIDWYPRGRQDMSGASYTHADNATLNNFATAATAVGTGKMAGFTGDATALGSSSGVTPAGWDGGGSPGLPSDPSQMTPLQFDVWNNSREKQKALRDKSDRVAQLTQERDDLQNNQIPKAKADLEAEKKGPLGGDPAKLDSLNKELKRLNDRLDKINKDELPDAQGDLDAEKYKANEPAKPAGREKDDGAKDFGSKFLGGIAQSLGFPDVFGGKAPWDFGIVKMLGRFATGAMNGMQNGGYGGGGIPGMGGLGSPTSFVDGLTGLKPSNGFQGGVPQIVTAPTPHMPNGPGPNAPSAPTVGGINISNDNSIHVHPSSDSQIVGAVQGLQNSSGRAQAIAASPSFGDVPSVSA